MTYFYYQRKVEATSQRELWAKFPDIVCRPYHHEFFPSKMKTKIGERSVDVCAKCMTVRIPSRMVYPRATTKASRIKYPKETKVV